MTGVSSVARDDRLLPSPSLFDFLGWAGFGDSHIDVNWLPAGLGPTLPFLLLLLEVSCADDEARETWLP